MRYMKTRSCDVDGRRCSKTPRPSIAASMLQLTDADDVSKRKQLCITVKVFVIISIPLLVLIGLVGWHTIHAGKKVLAGQEVRRSMDIFNQNANLVHALQDERISGAYMLLTGHDFNAKHAIQAKINVTLAKTYLCFFATQPHGLRSGCFALVLPPFGWSTGFFATPRTCKSFFAFHFAPQDPKKNSALL